MLDNLPGGALRVRLCYTSRAVRCYLYVVLLFQSVVAIFVLDNFVGKEFQFMCARLGLP